jgi:hypothetical protein
MSWSKNGLKSRPEQSYQPVDQETCTMKPEAIESFVLGEIKVNCISSSPLA